MLDVVSFPKSGSALVSRISRVVAVSVVSGASAVFRVDDDVKLLFLLFTWIVITNCIAENGKVDFNDCVLVTA